MPAVGEALVGSVLFAGEHIVSTPALPVHGISGVGCPASVERSYSSSSTGDSAAHVEFVRSRTAPVLSASSCSIAVSAGVLLPALPSVAASSAASSIDPSVEIGGATESAGREEGTISGYLLRVPEFGTDENHSVDSIQGCVAMCVQTENSNTAAIDLFPIRVRVLDSAEFGTCEEAVVPLLLHCPPPSFESGKAEYEQNPTVDMCGRGYVSGRTGLKFRGLVMLFGKAVKVDFQNGKDCPDVLFKVSAEDGRAYPIILFKEVY